MDPISPEELLSQLVEKVDLFAADPSEQEAWARANDYPAEEIALQFYDAMGTFLARLREHRLIDAADVAALEELKDYVSGVQSNSSPTDLMSSTRRNGNEFASLPQRRRASDDHLRASTHSGRVMASIDRPGDSARPGEAEAGPGEYIVTLDCAWETSCDELSFGRVVRLVGARSRETRWRVTDATSGSCDRRPG